jgi:shikimate dehydrogenase
MNTYGLIGKDLNHSFSPSYFANKFKEEGIDNCVYQLFPLSQIEDFKKLLRTQSNLQGLNVTIPYKTAIIPFLDELSPQAMAIGAVNTIKFDNDKLIGHNTDVYGFQTSLEAGLSLKQGQSKALILGTGGASKAVAYALKELNIRYQYVSRTASKGILNYENLNGVTINEHLIIINTTPLGMYPNVNHCPDLPYEAIQEKHLLYDLVYNPKETLFIKKGKSNKATTINGLKMLHLQAEKAWKIWQS